jgi:chitodextrinase
VAFPAQIELAAPRMTADAPPEPQRAVPGNIGPPGGFVVDLSRPLAIADYVALFAAVPPVNVNVGPLTLSVQADPSRGQALITATLSSIPVLTQLLFIGAPILELNVAVGTASATGSVTLQLLLPPQYSNVSADVVAVQGSDNTPYRGTITAWLATGTPVVGDFVTYLTGELSTLTTVRGVDANIAQFSFVSGAVPIAVAEATQFAPIQVFQNEIVAGNVYVEAGATITLTIPTQLAPGWLLLQATYGSNTTPPTKFSASVALWNLPPTD